MCDSFATTPSKDTSKDTSKDSSIGVVAKISSRPIRASASPRSLSLSPPLCVCDNFATTPIVVVLVVLVVVGVK